MERGYDRATDSRVSHAMRSSEIHDEIDILGVERADVTGFGAWQIP